MFRTFRLVETQYNANSKVYSAWREARLLYTVGSITLPTVLSPVPAFLLLYCALNTLAWFRYCLAKAISEARRLKSSPSNSGILTVCKR